MIFIHVKFIVVETKLGRGTKQGVITSVAKCALPIFYLLRYF